MTTDRPVVLVTGAAGGIGSAIVERLVADGAVVVATDRADFETTADVKLIADLTSHDEVQALVAACIESCGRLDGLVHAAGLLVPGRALNGLDTDVVDVNLVATSRITSAVGRYLVTQPRRGSIVVVGSNAGQVPRLDMASYCVSKAGVAMYVRCLGLELAQYGVRCNVIAPGSTDTPMLRSLWSADGDAERTLHGSLESYRTGIPLGQIAEPADVARVASFLLSADARHITMQTITVDGGAVLGV